MDNIRSAQEEVELMSNTFFMERFDTIREHTGAFPTSRDCPSWCGLHPQWSRSLREHRPSSGKTSMLALRLSQHQRAVRSHVVFPAPRYVQRQVGGK